MACLLSCCHDSDPDLLDERPDGRAQATCRRAANLDGSGSVGLGDLAIVLANWGQTCTDCPADVNGNGEVDLTDLATILSVFGVGCG